MGTLSMPGFSMPGFSMAGGDEPVNPLVLYDCMELVANNGRVDLGFKAALTHAYEIVLKRPEGKGGYFFGSYNSPRVTWYYKGDGTEIRVFPGLSYKSASNPDYVVIETDADTTQFHKITLDLNQKKAGVNDNLSTISVGASTNFGARQTKTLQLFSAATITNALSGVVVKSFDHYISGVLSKHLVPCTYHGVIGLWDTINDKFYETTDANAFIVYNEE